jgi:hypothetical protein
VAVAHETMLRVRRNIEMLIPRLETMGYRFYAHPTEYVNGYPPRLTVPDEQTRAQIDELEREFGPLPIALRAFYEVVGAVNLVGEPPVPEGEDPDHYHMVEFDGVVDGWHAGTQLDPLFIYGPRDTSIAWQEVRDDEKRCSTYRPFLFLDFLLKYRIGGVGPISIDAPSRSMDAPLMFQGGSLIGPDGGEFLFVKYLRFALDRGGFPGFGMDDEDPEPIIADEIRTRLVEGMLPF